MAQLGNLLVKGSSRFLNKVYFEDISIAGTSFFSGDISTDGTLNIGANKASNALLYLNKKIAIRGVDSWLRINDTSTNFTSGVYFGSSDVRTDKAFQVGDDGKYFKINSSSLNVNVSSVFSQRTTHNGGLISPTISSNLISFVKNGNTLPKIDGADVTAVLNELTVLSTLRAKEYELDHVQNLGGTFMVSPSFICTEGSTSVTVSAISGSEVTFVIKDNATLTKTEIATASWVLNSQIKLSGKIGNAILANATGTITKSVDTNNHTITVKVDVGSSTVGNFTVNTTYSGSQVSKLALMMIRNASGYRLGIYLESYSSENKKPVINIFDGSDTNPKVVLGKLDGTPKINNISPTGYGLYSDNAFLKGTIIATSGTIGGFTLSTNSIQNGTFGQDGSVMMSLGSNNSASIGDSGNINGWTFTAGSKFGVTKNGAMYATSGKIGGFNIDSTYLQSSDKTVGLSASASNWAFWAGGADISTAKFRVNHAGQLWATSADISGKITATSGIIGGCSIKDNVLQIANVNINSISAEKITSGTLDSDRIGANSITAEKITTDILKSKNYVSETSGSFLNLADGSFDSKYLKWDNAGKVIVNDITVVGGSINVNDKFIVNNDGIATLQGATVVGNITAESGKIGKFNLDNLALVTGDTDVTCAGLGGSSQAFWAGSLSMDNALFRVGYDGSLYASKANISGIINSINGNIGGWKISSDGIKSFYSHTDTVDTGISDFSNSLSLLSDTSSIILNCDSKSYSDSSRKNILERGVNSLSLNESLIQGSSKNTVYGEENEEQNYSFYLSAMNGLQMQDNISGDDTVYSWNGILFNDGSRLNSAKCHAGLVAHYWNSNGVSCGTKSGNYVNLTSFSDGLEGKLSELYYKKSNYQIAVSRNGVYSFQIRLGINSLTANKRVEVALFKNGSRYAAYSASYTTPIDYTLTQLNNYILYLSEGDTIDFRIAPIDGYSVNVNMADILIYALDYDFNGTELL